MSSSMDCNGSRGESLTIQLGNKANGVGGHLWNYRKKYANILNGDQTTGYQPLHHCTESGFYPRTVIVEFPDNLGPLTDLNEITNSIAPSSIWNGPITVSNSALTNTYNKKNAADIAR